MSATLCCSADGCTRPTRGGRTHCDAHAKRAQRGTPMDAPLGLEPAARLADAAVELAEADAEDDRDYDARLSRLLAAAREYAYASATPTDRLLDRLMVRLRRDGRVRVGRPVAVQGDASELVRQHGGVRAAARALGCSAPSILRALRRQ